MFSESIPIEWVIIFIAMIIILGFILIRLFIKQNVKYKAADKITANFKKETQEIINTMKANNEEIDKRMVNIKVRLEEQQNAVTIFLKIAESNPVKYKLILDKEIKRLKDAEANALNNGSMKGQIEYLVAFGLNDLIEEGFGLER